MIVSLHVATGAAAGALVRSRSLALILGPPLHLAGDRVPHEDIPDRSFEIGSGLVALALLAARRGPLDPAVLGGAAAALPDLEHVAPWLRLRGGEALPPRRRPARRRDLGRERSSCSPARSWASCSRAAGSLARVKVGIVVPYSWSFGGGVVDHADAQARALEAVGIETRLLIGNDPPGSFSRILHPRQGRPGPPPRA